MHRKHQTGVGGSHGYKLPKIKLSAHGVGGAKPGGLGGSKHGINPAKGYKLPKMRLPKVRLDY